MSISFSNIKSLSCNNADILKVENSARQIIWSETFDISYDAKGGLMPSMYEDSYRYGKGLSKLPIPTRSNYLFNGWKNNAAGDFITTITTTDKTNFNLVASWTYTPPTPTYIWKRAINVASVYATLLSLGAHLGDIFNAYYHDAIKWLPVAKKCTGVIDAEIRQETSEGYSIWVEGDWQ